MLRNQSRTKVANQLKQTSLLLAVPGRLFGFGSLVVSDMVCGYILFFLLDIKMENR